MQKICVVIPCYNEENRLSIIDFTESYNQSNLYYLFVNDGSKDLTADVLNNFMKGREERVNVLHLEKNSGKAEAVRSGMLAALNWQSFSIIGYLDADLATPLRDIEKLVNHFDSSTHFIFGSRVQRIGANIKRKWSRHILGRVFATIASNMLDLTVYDTQCGAKFFRSGIVKQLFTDKFLTKWIFDLELFFRLSISFKNENINLIAKEIPLENWEDVSGSKLKFTHMMKIPFELFKLYRFITKNRKTS